MALAVEPPRLRLIGDLYKGVPDKTIPFLYQTFGRFSEVGNHGEITRQIQYASGTGEDYIHFLGIEVDKIEYIPEGWMAWDINGDLWSVLQARGGVNEVIWQEKLTWDWLDQSVQNKPCGEFIVKCPEAWNGGIRSFRIMSNGYIGAPCNDDIYLVDYDPVWPQKYIEKRDWLQELLGSDIALRIEHYGSTSIPGIPAKPVIDILVEIPSFEAARKRAIPALNSPEIEYWCSDHMRFYIRDKVTGVRTCHLHMAPADHKIWEGLAFRDYLRTHPDDASRYVALKYELSQRYRTDREAYTDAKETFVREITDRALLKITH